MSDLALDTNAVTALQRDDPAALAIVRNTSTWILPVPVLGELYFGAFNSGRPAQNLHSLEQFISTCAIATVDADVCRIYGRLRVALRKDGSPIPQNDVWIAAVCLTLGVPL
ncbi:MAG TPA: PIN domain-containing protein, partial [Armatimonadota bacterium]|nr:PIN domain-containing protein [Armatimonadota bacterium]